MAGIVFLKTDRGSNGLYAHFRIFSFEQWLRKVSKYERYEPGWKFCVLGESVERLTSMSLKTFEEYIPYHMLDKSTIKLYFRGDIKTKYGKVDKVINLKKEQ